MSDDLKAALEGRILFVSSGDAEKDAETARGIIRHAANEAEGLCPNGCAPLEPYVQDGEVWPDAKTCPTCGFVGMGPSYTDRPTA